MLIRLHSMVIILSLLESQKLPAIGCCFPLAVVEVIKFPNLEAGSVKNSWTNKLLHLLFGPYLMQNSELSFCLSTGRLGV